MKKGEWIGFIIGLIIVIGLITVMVLGAIKIKRIREEENQRIIEMRNNKFSEYYQWETCDDEWYFKTSEFDESSNPNYFAKIEYRIVNEYQAYIKVYEDNYESGGDIFELSINGDYEIMCYTDR